MFQKIYKKLSWFCTQRWFALFLPLALFLVYFIGFPNCFYNTVGWVDGWGYTGLFLDYPNLRAAFAQHPSGDLLSLVFPGALFYQLFTPFYANLLFKLCRFVLIGWMFFRFLEMQTNRRSAGIGVLFLLTAFPFIEAVRTDYTDGMVVCYLTGCLFCFAKAYAAGVRKNLWLILGGVCFAGSASTALLSMTLGIPLGLFIIIKQYALDKRVLSIIKAGLWTTVGFVGMVFLLAAIHASLGFDWLFFKGTLAKASSFLNQTRSPFSLWESLFLDGPSWFFIFGVMSLVGVCCFLLPMKRVNRTVWTALSLFAAALLVYAGLQFFKNQETISNIYYINHLLPFAAFAVAAVLSPVLEQLNSKQFVWFSVAAVYTAALPFVVIPGFFPQSVSWKMWLCFSLPVLLPVAGMWRSKGFWLLLVFLITWGYANFCPRWVLEPYNQHMYLGKTLKSPQLLEATAAWVDFVRYNDPDRQYYLWYNAYNNWLFRHMAASSHLWQGRVINEELPKTSGGVIGGFSVPLENVSKVMLMAENADALNTARTALANFPAKHFTCDAGRIVYSSSHFVIWSSKCEAAD